MIVDKYWEVNENSVKDVMDIFLRLFVPESKVLSKNKPIKWCVIKEKALPVTKAHFDSKVEAAMQRTLQVEALLDQLQTGDIFQMVSWRMLTMILAMMRTGSKLCE